MRKRLCVSGQREFSLEERLTKYKPNGTGARLFNMGTCLMGSVVPNHGSLLPFCSYEQLRVKQRTFSSLPSVNHPCKILIKLPIASQMKVERCDSLTPVWSTQVHSSSVGSGTTPPRNLLWGLQGETGNFDWCS